jgi:predicted tellurium resistance membrane protein TerC
MTDETGSQDAKALWLSQPAEPTPLDLEELKRRARWSARIIVLRNAVDYAAFVFAGVVLVFVSSRFGAGAAFWIAALVSIVAMAGGAYLMWRHVSVMAPPAEASAREYLAFQKAQLARQLAGVRLSWLWYIAPFLVVAPAFYLASVIEAPAKAREAALVFGLMVVATVAITFAMNAVRVLRLRRMLAHFERLEAGD